MGDQRRILDLEARLKQGQRETMQLVSNVVQRATEDRKSLLSQLRSVKSDLKEKTAGYSAMFGELAGCKAEIGKKQAEIVKFGDLVDKVQWKEEVANKLRLEGAESRSQINDLEIKLAEAKLALQKMPTTSTTAPNVACEAQGQIQEALEPEPEQGQEQEQGEFDIYIADFGESPPLSDADEDFNFDLEL